MIRIYKKEEQVNGQFNGGAILEKKPVGFPQDGGKLKPYSNLFYWAHAWSDEGSTIGLHPHQGFEIMTFVIEGEINHYDTKIKQWRNLKKGDVQIIRAGNGISHAERLEPGAHLFQIWFDPDLKKSIKNAATYDDYSNNIFPIKEKGNDKIITYVSKNAPIKLNSNIIVKEIFFSSGQKEIEQIKGYFTSVFIIDGNLKLDNTIIEKDDFLILTEQKNSDLTILKNSRIFILYTPDKLNYKTYAEQYL